MSWGSDKLPSPGTPEYAQMMQDAKPLNHLEPGFKYLTHATKHLQYPTDDLFLLSKKEHEEYMSLIAKLLEAHVPSTCGGKKKEEDK